MLDRPMLTERMSVGGLLCAATILFAVTGYSSAHAQALAQPEVLAPLVATPTVSPSPVLGSDNRLHLVYEIVLMNMAPGTVRIEEVDLLDAANDAVLATLEGEALTRMLRLNGAAKGSELAGGGSGILFVDLAIPEGAAVPTALNHRFEIQVAASSDGTSGGDADPMPEPPEEITFVTEPLQVGPPAVVVAPPLEGSRWVAAGGCCTPYSYHRGATLPINGTIYVAERFAIDFVQLNDENRISSGPRDQLSSYAYFGTEIHSVAEGVVVAAEDGLPEQVPGKLPDDASIQMAAGNHIVVDIGDGRFAFYAHMQPGSLRVNVGDKVATGQVLGLLGNSGNTDAPHLHFHIMDGPSPLAANGLPYVFTAFSREGRVSDEQALSAGRAVTIETAGLAGTHRNQLPLNLDVVSFP